MEVPPLNEVRLTKVSAQRCVKVRRYTLIFYPLNFQICRKIVLVKIRGGMIVNLAFMSYASLTPCVRDIQNWQAAEHLTFFEESESCRAILSLYHFD